VRCTILVDGMDDVSRALFGDLPSPAFIVDASGRIVEKLPWADPDQIGERLKALATAVDSRPAAARSVPELIGQARARLAAKDYEGAREALASALRSTKDPSVRDSRTRGTVAEAHLALAAAQRGVADAGAPAAADAAAAEARIAWTYKPARLVAALCELATLEPAGASAHARWLFALDALEAGAPKSQRTWLEGRVNATRP
jgi:hypothetical protein